MEQGEQVLTKPFFTFLLTVGLVALSAGWTLAGYWQLGLPLLLLLPVSLFLRYHKFQPTMGLLLILVVVLAGVGVWARLDLPWMLAAVMCSLAAWDLDEFSHSLVKVPEQDNPRQIELDHLKRLGAVLFMGLLISLVSQFIQLKSAFEWAIVLAMLAFVGIGTLVTGMRSRDE